MTVQEMDGKVAMIRGQLMRLTDAGVSHCMSLYPILLVMIGQHREGWIRILPKCNDILDQLHRELVRISSDPALTFPETTQPQLPLE